jgi:hypothetical protein
MRKKLGEILLNSCVVAREDIDAVLSDQSAGEPGRLGDLLVSQGKISPEQLARALSEQYGLPYVQLPVIDSRVLVEIGGAFQKQHRIVPFELDGTVLSVAVADPSNIEAIEGLRLLPGRSISLFVAPGDEIDSIHASTTKDLVVSSSRPTVSPPTVSPLSADDLFADLSLETISAVRLSPIGEESAAASAVSSAEPPASGGALSASEGRVVIDAEVVIEVNSEFAPEQEVEPAPLSDDAFAAPGEVARATPSLERFDAPESMSSPSGIRELKLPPARLDPVAMSQTPITLPEWLSAASGETDPGIRATAPSGPPAAGLETAEEWSGALDGVAPSKLVVALVKSLLRRGLVSEGELLEALKPK